MQSPNWLTSAVSFFFFFKNTAPPEIYPLSLHAALPFSPPPPLITSVTRLFPVVGHQLTSPAAGVQATPPTLLVTLVLYLTESAKYASSAVTRLRRSDFIEAR